MAGLEDCVRLDVDACNLSLGAAGGFTTGDMSKTLELFESTDIEVLIAAGNETNAHIRTAPDGISPVPATPMTASSVPRVRFLPLCPLPPSTTTAQNPCTSP